jgi:CCR4-NOT transcription complex subunit 1
MLYRATLRIFLILLHDFPDFLSGYHHSLVDTLPPACIQLKNLILSAFPPDMRLPDPFTPNLKVNLLPEITQSPVVLSDYTQILVDSNLKPDIDSFVKSGDPNSFYEVVNYSFLSKDSSMDGKYNISIINSFVLYVGVKTISLQPHQDGPPNFKNTVSIDIFKKLLKEIDSEGKPVSIT